MCVLRWSAPEHWITEIMERLFFLGKPSTPKKKPLVFIPENQTPCPSPNSPLQLSCSR